MVDEKKTVDDKKAANGSDFSRRTLFGVIVMLVGAGLLLQNFNWFSFNYVWPVIIIVIGLFLVMRK